MRITLSMSTNETLLNLNTQQEQLNTVSDQISSGVMMQAPSDDPSDWSQSMNANQTIREYNSFISNVNYATNWGNATESSLSQLSSLLSQAQSIAETSTSLSGSSSNTDLASEVGGILNQAMTIANSQYNGQYIFAGTATDTEPYSIDSSTGAVTYSGNDSNIEVKTSTGDTSSADTAVNLTGDAVFGSTSGGSNILQDLWNLQQALTNNDSTAISSSLTAMNNDFDQVNNQLTVIGTSLSSLTTQQTALNTMLTNEKGVLSNDQDTDVASATIKLSQAQTSFEAALKVASTLDGLDLASILS